MINARHRFGKKLGNFRGSVRLQKIPYAWIYTFLAPTLILYSMYTLWPITATFLYSFTDWTGFERSGDFIGLANYAELFMDPMFWNSIRVTLTFMIVVVPLRVILSLIVAIILNWKRFPARNIFRTAIFIPVVTTGAIIGVIMNMIFDPQNGPVNLILTKLGFVNNSIFFLGTADYALMTAAAIWLWKWLGTCLIYWLASLQSIPEELYEAAKVDGAGPIKTFFLITAPLLKPFAMIITVLTISDSMRVFDLMLTLTGGGPFFKTEVIELFIYRWAFTASIPRLGYASTAATLFGLFFIVITVIQVYSKNLSFKKGGQN